MEIRGEKAQEGREKLKKEENREVVYNGEVMEIRKSLFQLFTSLILP